MKRSSSDGATDTPILGAAFLALLAAMLVGLSVERVRERLRFGYDLVLWADDYLMTSLMKLRAGVPVYTSLSDANSTVYSPGGAYLHYALLRPLGLDGSVAANKLLAQVWLAVGVCLSVWAVVEVGRRDGWVPPGRLGRGLHVVLSGLVLALAAYTNPMADSLHPTTLEMCVFGATAVALVRWDRLGSARRWTALVALPAVGLLVKQTCGFSVAVALAWVASLHCATVRKRAAAAAAPVASFAIALGFLHWWTDGFFTVWGIDVLAAHPFDWWKVTDLYEGYGLLFVPVLGVAAYRAVLALGRRAPGDRAWLRCAVLVFCHAPLALAALFKRLGGPNNLAVLGFLLAVLAAPTLIGSVMSPRLAGGRRGAFVVLLAQLLAWYPRRRTPDARDYANAEEVCRYAAARMRCGDEVLVGRGSVCYARGGVAVPLDRVTSLIEVTAAGRGEELGFYRRIADEEYDVLIIPIGDLFWFGRPLWERVRGKYTAFYMTKGEAEGDFWYHGWQGFSSRPIVFFERVSEKGTHHVDEAGMRCSAAAVSR